MTTETRRTPISWRKRANFRIGSTRKQRQAQFQQQKTVLAITLLVTVVAGGLFMFLNWQGAGATKTLSCEDFPQYCVPLVGGAEGEGKIAENESATTRTLDGESTAAAGVVRGFIENRPFLGDPNAPIQFVEFFDYACSHCQEFHEGDLRRFINDYVLTGKASFQSVMLSGTGGPYSETANQAALCAGEQGAFWEMNDELYRLVMALGPANGFSDKRIRASAERMNLDADALITCMGSDRYRSFLLNYRTFSNDNGITGTPTILYRFGNEGSWQRTPDRTYETLQSLTERANQNAQ